MTEPVGNLRAVARDDLGHAGQELAGAALDLLDLPLNVVLAGICTGVAFLLAPYFHSRSLLRVRNRFAYRWASLYRLAL